MKLQFQKHYSVEEARALLPRVREWLTSLQQILRKLQNLDERLRQLLDEGAALGGGGVNQMVRLIAERNEILEEFQSREIQIKDVDRGLLDFPSIIGGREVFLCWEQDEDDI